MQQVDWFTEHIGNIITASVAAAVGYFASISGVLTVMVTCIMLDQVFGLIAAHKRGEAIKGEKLWITAKKLFYSIVIVSLLFAMDTEMAMIELHRFVAFAISGWEMWSIAGSAAYISDHDVFDTIRVLMRDKIEEKTGIDISSEDEDG